MMEYHPKYSDGDRVIVLSIFSRFDGETGVIVMYCSGASLIEFDNVTYQEVDGTVKPKRSWVINRYFEKLNVSPGGFNN